MKLSRYRPTVETVAAILGFGAILAAVWLSLAFP